MRMGFGLLQIDFSRAGPVTAASAEKARQTRLWFRSATLRPKPPGAAGSLPDMRKGADPAIRTLSCIPIGRKT
ncbi:hypothetical protein MPPM_1911 [Methylorubrum populi]|uniref:Uncharacterized protein n=1 Tax=Methylorubrum populi TaxID=223967 RepID=A0A160PDG7_9HYPH|nr:hypothetical protein MPPM_1911 [Methylorubrum populi]